MKYCVDCKHHAVVFVYGASAHRCLRPIEDRVRGIVARDSRCENEREHCLYFCGLEAKFWEPVRVTDNAESWSEACLQMNQD